MNFLPDFPVYWTLLMVFEAGFAQVDKINGVYFLNFISW
jgi:hypothetical protein